MRMARYPGIAISLTLLLVLAVAPAPAQQRVRHGMPADNLKVEVTADGGVPHIPFRMVNHHIIVDVKVNGSGPFSVVLDTGMPGPSLVLYGSEQVDALDLDYSSAMQAAVGGAGGSGKRITAQIVMDQQASFPGLRLGDIRLTLLPPLPDFATYHDGIIGAALFRNFVVEIDQDAGVIRLRDPETYRPPESAAALSLELRNGIPFTTLEVTTESGARVPVSLAVDLGASHPISLNAGTAEGLAVPPGAIETVIGRGLSGELRGKVGRIATIDLGGAKLENVIATFPEEEHHNPRGMDSRNGNLGNGIMSRFNITFDYAHDRMLLLPARHFSDPFEHDMSGLVLRDGGGDGLPVQDILAGSPAAGAGLRAGDVLVELDGRSVSDLGLYGVRDLLRRDGTRVTLVYTRDGQQREVNLTLTRLV